MIRRSSGLSAASSKPCGRPEPPALLFTASHGLAFPGGHPLQRPHQGALLCQDWPGPLEWDGPIPPSHYLAADDIADDVRAAGMIAFHFACFGAGTPALYDFAHLRRFGSARALASRPFVARLPQRLLGLGALAIIGHVERAWTRLFRVGDGVGRQLQVFQGVLQTLLDGHRVGWALESFAALYAALATELTGEFALEAQGQHPDDSLVASLGTAHNDARGFVVLGDPATRLAPLRS